MIQIFSSKESLISLLIEHRSKGKRLEILLPCRAAAITGERIVERAVVVHVSAGQDGGPARATQRAVHKLQNQKENHAMGEEYLMSISMPIIVCMTKLTAFLK